MKKRHLLFTLFLFFFFITSNYGQNESVIRCGADELHEEKMKDNQYRQKFNAIKRIVHDQLKYRTPSCTDPIIIPIAVHWNGSITNANMTCLIDVTNDQIDALNEDFGGYNTDIVSYCNHAANCPTEYPIDALAGGTCIQFCLATQNHPAGSGLSNGDAAFSFGTYTFDTGATLWSGYFNFFVSNVPPNGYSSTLLGLAPLFGGGDPDGNGVFITRTAFGGDNYSCTSGIQINGSSNYGLGRTGTHEAGHYFGLYHTFSNCSPGDGIADTPAQSSDNGGVNTINYGTCVSTANNTCGTQDFFFNYMDYSNDNSMYMFTSDQSDVMYTTATTGANHATNPYKTAATTCGTVPTGYAPTYPTGCPALSTPESIFSTSNTPPYEFCPMLNTFNLVDASTGFATSWSWTFSGAGVSPTSSTEQNPSIQVNSTGTLTVTLTASNNAGADPTPATMNYSITMLSAASCADCGSTNTDTGGSGSNYSNNEDETWTLCANAGENVKLEFTTIDIQPFVSGVGIVDGIYVFNGGVVGNISAADYYIFGTSIYRKIGNTYFPIGTSSIISTEACFSFRFLSNGSTTEPGWVADVTCIPEPTCSDGYQNQDEVFVDCGGSTCPTCPTPEEGFVFTDAGGANNPTGTQTREWQFCANDVNETVSLDFTTIDMSPFNNGILRVYNGATNNGNNYDYYITGSSIYISNGGGGLTSFGNSMITSPGQCLTASFFNANESSNGWVANVSSSAALPLSLISFEAEAQKQHIALNWISAQEINVDHIVLERREGSETFQSIFKTEACGNCNDKNSYHYDDRNVIAGKVYNYRLKIVDLNGQFEYSEMINAKIVFDDSDFWSIYPNPGRGLFTLDLGNLQVKRVSIVNKLGQLVHQQDISSDEQMIELNLDNLHAGYYQLVLTGDKNSSKPLVILP